MLSLEGLFWYFLATLFGFFASLLVPICPYIGVIGVLVCVDLYTGVRAAKVRAEKIQSQNLHRTIAKIRDYFIVLLLSEMMVQVFFMTIPITYFTASFIGLLEFRSVIDNIGQIRKIDIWNHIKDLFGNGKRKG